MPTLCGYTWPDTLDAVIRDEAQRAGAPLDLVYAIIAVESGFNPSAHVDNALEDSVGLLQLNRRGGQGAGYPVDFLQDPRNNLRIGLPAIVTAFHQVWQPGLNAYDFIYQVATRSGHPGPVPRDDPRIRRLAQVWSCFYPAAGDLYLAPGADQHVHPGPAQTLVATVLTAALLLAFTPIGVVYEISQVRSSLAIQPSIRPQLPSFALVNPRRALPRFNRPQSRGGLRGRRE
jgi:hypothetical protein